MRDYYQLKINLPGGIASPGFLKGVLAAAWGANVREARFGARQQLLMTVHYEDARFLESDLKKLGVFYELQTDRFPNILSSYCAEEVFRTGGWLNAGEYHSIFDQFDYQPALKVNISDSNQSFTPFFTGNLNFVSSPEPHYWFLYIRPKQSNTVFKWRELIYSSEIGRVAKALEKLMLEEGICEENELYARLNNNFTFLTKPAAEELALPPFSLPYYEGFNRYESRSWLGLYRRDEQFSIELLLDICSLCLKTRIGEICTTGWKSLIIKGIEDAHRAEWSQVLGKHNINVRHAANELCWQTEDFHFSGKQIKDKLIRHFAKNDTRTFGLCFGIQTRPKSEVFGSVIIKKRSLINVAGFHLLSVYDVFHTENFNPNNRNLVLFQQGLFGIHLSWQLERLCRKFNNLRSLQTSSSFLPETENALQEPQTKTVYQCPDCLTCYDEEYGDTMQAIPAGTPFAALPDTYQCSTCDCEKLNFVQTEIPHEYENPAR